MNSEQARYSFRNLRIWESAQELAADIIRLLARLPRSNAVRGVEPQLVASAGSVGANIAEGHGRYSVPAYRNHLSIARGSLAETESWLDLLKRVDLISAEADAEFQRRCAELAGGITRQMVALEKRLEQRGRIREESPPYGPDNLYEEEE